jgi:hypothetical protein
MSSFAICKLVISNERLAIIYLALVNLSNNREAVIINRILLFPSRVSTQDPEELFI